MRLFAALSSFVAAIGVVAIAPAPEANAAGQLFLVSQDFNLTADGSFRFEVAFPDESSLAALTTATLVVTAYRAVATREAVTNAFSGTLPRSADSVDLPLAELARTTASSVQGLVQLESTTRTPDKLQLAQPGLYPITLEVRDGNEVIADLITLVHRLPAATDQVDDGPAADLPIALAMHPTLGVQLDDDGAVVVDDEVIGELTQLADLLEVIGPTGLLASVSIAPAWLDVLGANGEAELADRLAAALQPHDVLSAPRLPLDASQAAAANQQALFTEWLRDGDDILAAAIAKPSVRTSTFVDSPLSQAGAALHRDLGSRLLVMTSDIYNDLPGALVGLTDTSKLFTIEVAAGVRIEATVPDPRTSALLATEGENLALTAIQAVANLLAARQEILDEGELPSRRAITLAMPNLSLPETTTMEAIASLLAATPGFKATTLDEVGVRTDRLTVDGDLALVGLPATVAGSLAERLAPIANLVNEAVSTASMLPVTDDRPAEWTRVIEQLPSSAVTDEQVASTLSDLQEQFQAVRSSVGVPQGFSFTLTGRRTTVPIKLQNTSDVPLTVRVRMSSSKLLFPGGDQVVTLPPQAFFDVEIPIEVRTNGRFPVTLEVFTPTGNVRLAPPVRLSARVNAISGLGNLVTGALLLVVVTWWVRHVRHSRRRRSAQKSSLNHPVRNERTNLPEL